MPKKAAGLTSQTEPDGTLERLECWKKRAFAAIVLISLLLVGAKLLLVETSEIHKMWEVEFGGAKAGSVEVEKQIP